MPKSYVLTVVLLALLASQVGIKGALVYKEMGTQQETLAKLNGFVPEIVETTEAMRQVSHTLHSHIYTTAKHLDVKDVEEETGYVFLYAEEDTDRAFYFIKDKPYLEIRTFKNVGTVNGAEGDISNVTEGEFLFEVQPGKDKAVVGDTIVNLDTGHPLGIIQEEVSEFVYKVLTVN